MCMYFLNFSMQFFSACVSFCFDGRYFKSILTDVSTFLFYNFFLTIMIVAAAVMTNMMITMSNSIRNRNVLLLLIVFCNGHCQCS